MLPHLIPGELAAENSAMGRFKRLSTAADYVFGGISLIAVGIAIPVWILTSTSHEEAVRKQLREHGREAEASVVSVEKASRTGEPSAFKVRYDIPSGSITSRVGVDSSSVYQYAGEGKIVYVIYDPAQPSIARLEGSIGPGVAKSGRIEAGFIMAFILVAFGTSVARKKPAKRIRR